MRKLKDEEPEKLANVLNRCDHWQTEWVWDCPYCPPFPFPPLPPR